MEELRGMELLPEPGEPRILSAIDPSTRGFQDQWRAEVTGWAPVIPDSVSIRPRRAISVISGAAIALVMALIVVLWQSDLLLLELPPPFIRVGLRGYKYSRVATSGFDRR